MPSTYTHYRFGLDVLNGIDGELERIIEENKELYLIGLHGPDIIFYYGALGTNIVNRKGFAMHREIAADFFWHAKRRLKRMREREAGIAYIMGFICHFILDSECHSYIEYVIRFKNLTHAEIETDFERELLLKDGKNIRTYNTASHIQPSVESAAIIESFFDTVNKRQIFESLKSMKKYNKLLVPSNVIKKELIKLVLFATSNYEQMHGLIIEKNGIDRCMESNQELERLYQEAIPIAADLMKDYYEKLNTKEDLNHRFYRTFGPDSNKMRRYEGGGIHVEVEQV